MTEVQWDHYPLVIQIPRTQAWLHLQANLGLAPNTVAAYGRALNDYLAFCQDRELDIEAVTKEQIAQYVHDLASRPNPRGLAIRVLDSGTGLANATLQQRLTAIRLFYDYLVEEGYRETNPVGRGRYTAGKGFGGKREKGLIPRYTKLPWIPNDDQWQVILRVACQEPIRNRMMLALAYDAGLRREELCALRTDDLDPAQRHLCLTDLARSGWELHAIATFAGHRSLSTTLQYIHLSGRDLADKLERSMAQIHSWRGQLLAEGTAEKGDLPS